MMTSTDTVLNISMLCTVNDIQSFYLLTNLIITHNNYDKRNYNTLMVRDLPYTGEASFTWYIRVPY